MLIPGTAALILLVQANKRVSFLDGHQFINAVMTDVVQFQVSLCAADNKDMPMVRQA
ncbi:MAG TPA: hypothetical protein VIF37_03865 [Methylobacter sp.]|jgi:hypothetical protein